LPTRRPIVGVIGSGSEEHRGLTKPIGELLAKLNVHLLTGGGRGVMTAVSQAFAAIPHREGLVIGILPCREGHPSVPKNGYPNRWVDIAIPTHLPLSGEQGTDPMSRNHLNILASDVILALPGGPGTSSEITLAVRYQKPILAFFETHDQITGLPSAIPVTQSLAEVEKFLRKTLKFP
jgi:uncharacterized protein (TIGR00725 family)